MRRIGMYLRQCFRAHQFKTEEARVEQTGGLTERSGTKVYQYCPRCGYHRSFWKF